MKQTLKLWSLLILAGILSLATPVHNANAAITKNFFNILTQDGADPSVYKHTDGLYYSSYTTGGDIRLWRHGSLSGMESAESGVDVVMSGHRKFNLSIIPGIYILLKTMEIMLIIECTFSIMKMQIHFKGHGL